MKTINLNKLGFSKWRSLILIITLLISKNTFATFHVAGYINCTQISGYTYRIKIETYTSVITFIDMCNITLHISNGDSIILNRTNGINGVCVFPSKMGEYIGDAINQNIFEGTYTFQNENLYTLSATYGNRYSELMNISNSTPHPFYLETKLFVFDPNNYCISNSIGFAYLPIAKAYINTKYESNIPINKTDGDSLTYHLTSCKENGLDIPQYFIPNDIIINEHTGQITWLQPSQLGQWSFAIIVKKWRKNILVGTSLLDYTIEVISAPYTLQNITVNTNCILNADSTYTCNINPTDTMQILLTDSNCNIILYTEIDTINNYTFQNDTTIFKWNPTIINARHNPYKLTFRHYKLLPILDQYKDITFFITVNETTQNSCITPPNLSEINPISENETLSIYPNPSTNQLYINAPNKSNISISNILGEQILIAHNIIQNSAIDISTLPTGIYNITIQTNTKTTDTKFIKQ